MVTDRSAKSVRQCYQNDTGRTYVVQLLLLTRVFHVDSRSKPHIVRISFPVPLPHRLHPMCAQHQKHAFPVAHSHQNCCKHVPKLQPTAVTSSAQELYYTCRMTCVLKTLPSFHWTQKGRRPWAMMPIPASFNCAESSHGTHQTETCTRDTQNHRSDQPAASPDVCSV